MFKNIYRGKKVLLTGHTGFKGSWLSLWLQDLGAEVYGYSEGSVTNPSHFELLELEKTIDHQVGDIRDEGPLKRYIEEVNPEFIFHLAANALVRDCYEDPREAFMTNTMGTLHLLNSLKAASNLRSVIMITSDKCYENVEWEYGYREDDRLGGSDPYSASKACAEIIFSSYFRSYFRDAQFKIASVRAGNVIGGGDWAKNRIVPDCMKSWSKNESVEIRNPQSTRPWQHVLEPLSGYLWLAANLYLDKVEDINGESFNFGPSSDVNQPVSILIEEMGKYWDSAKWQKSEEAVGNKKEANLLKLCCDKALHRLGWEPNLYFEETVQLTADWYKSYYQAGSSTSCQSKSLSQILRYQSIGKERKRAWAV